MDVGQQESKIMAKTTAKVGISILFLMAIIFVMPFLGSLLVIGAGYLLNLIVGIGHLQSSVVFIATLFTGVLAIGLTFVTEEIRKSNTLLQRDLDIDEDDEWDEEAEESEMDWESLHQKMEPVSRTPRVGRNHPCPCGSNKKYKMCCLRTDTQAEDIPF